MNTGLDQYMDIFKDAVEDSAAKLTKSFEKILTRIQQASAKLRNVFVKALLWC
jgi:hypothetical protein